MQNYHLLFAKTKNNDYICRKNQEYMDAIQSININLPSSDLGFLKELIQRMGWSANALFKENKLEKQTDKLSMADAERYVASLAVRGRKTVPANERGIDALIDMKYSE